jgi:hypothetical protein
VGLDPARGNRNWFSTTPFFFSSSRISSHRISTRRKHKINGAHGESQTTTSQMAEVWLFIIFSITKFFAAPAVTCQINGWFGKIERLNGSNILGIRTSTYFSSCLILRHSESLKAARLFLNPKVF